MVQPKATVGESGIKKLAIKKNTKELNDAKKTV